jgi:4-aminobutyrate aminotransferase
MPDVPDIRTPLPGPIARAYLERDHRFVSQSYTRIYPLVCARALGAVVEDVDGNRFLDFTAGIAVTATGHCHPEVVAAIREQAGTLIHMSGTDFYYPPQIELAERLARLVPGDFEKKVFFANSGAESIEAALKLARIHTGRSRVVAFFGAFHGRTYGAMSLSASKLTHRRGFAPLVPDIHHVPFPIDDTGRTYEFDDTIFHRTCPPDETAAIFIEPIQGEGGYHVAPPAFLKALRAFCDQHGILLVADEVQSGFGRTGKMFALEHAGIAADIVCLAKGIASGLPLGAVVARAEVMDWPSGSHASTFGGNPVACRAALATLDLLEREYVANAAERGEQMRAGLVRLREEFDFIGDVRGLGLMLAMDVLDPARDPEAGPRLDPAGRDRLVQRAFERGLLLLGCGAAALRFCPPLCVNAAEVDRALAVLREVFGSDRAARAENASYG